MGDKTAPALELDRTQILAHRRSVGALDERLPFGPESLRRAAWAGLQDSVPRAALFSIHARVEATHPSAWEDPSLVQLWGPGYRAYVVAARDAAVFSLGRLPDGAAARRRAEDLADRLRAFLDGRRMTYSEAGHALGVKPNELRYAAPTGTLLIRWDGARQPMIWTVPRPDVDAQDARLELARRYLHVFGPAIALEFAAWAGIAAAAGPVAFQALQASLVPARTPTGNGWILESDEASFRAPGRQATTVRLLPSGDVYYLHQGAGRELLVPDPAHRAELWTPRVWPGAVLVDGEIVGTWRRSQADVTIAVWRPLSADRRRALEAEAASLPVPGIQGQLRVRWNR